VERQWSSDDSGYYRAVATKARVGSVGLLLFGSGACALIYQTVWLRQFRLIFGASTAASAAVLAIFMGGLGLGGLLIGKRIDRLRNPLAIYGFLEVGVSLFAGLTPILFWLVRHLYLAMGGSFALGQFVATVVRLLLSVVVLAIPTILMGGTLPAASRAVEGDDAGRLSVSILYAANTVGAVIGTVFSTFYLLETFGNLKALIAAALLNAIVGLAAIAYSNRVGDSDITHEASTTPAVAPHRLVYAAAAVVGFAFFLMELVWYRMLAPILGGTTYTFGLILAVALAGIGAGSFVYALLRRTRATLGAFAVLCAVEALTIAIPFALGDRLASLSLFLRALGTFGFSGFVLAWSLVTVIVIFLPAFIAGAQFPVLISLLGEGAEDVGRHVDDVPGTRWAQSRARSSAEFGALPLLTAPGAVAGGRHHPGGADPDDSLLVAAAGACDQRRGAGRRGDRDAVRERADGILAAFADRSRTRRADAPGSQHADRFSTDAPPHCIVGVRRRGEQRLDCRRRRLRVYRQRQERWPRASTPARRSWAASSRHCCIRIRSAPPSLASGPVRRPAGWRRCRRSKASRRSRSSRRSCTSRSCARRSIAMFCRTRNRRFSSAMAASFC
jgi:hypothetical protein